MTDYIGLVKAQREAIDVRDTLITTLQRERDIHNALMTEAATKMDELRAERDQWKTRCEEQQNWMDRYENDGRPQP